MSLRSFRHRFAALAESNHEQRARETCGEAGAPATGALWWRSLGAVSRIYLGGERTLVRRALADPYFPVTMFWRLNVEGFATEPASQGMSPRRLTLRMVAHLGRWVRMFAAIRRDLALLRGEGRVCRLRRTGSPREGPPDGGWCDFCGSCCEIRGGPPDFAAGFVPPRQWIRYFRGDASRDQRFCPFLVEYYATSTFFCAIYPMKPRCCWSFDREECSFLRADLARERAARSGR